MNWPSLMRRFSCWQKFTTIQVDLVWSTKEGSCLRLLMAVLASKMIRKCSRKRKSLVRKCAIDELHSTVKHLCSFVTSHIEKAKRYPTKRIRRQGDVLILRNSVFTPFTIVLCMSWSSRSSIPTSFRSSLIPIAINILSLPPRTISKQWSYILLAGSLKEFRKVFSCRSK